MPMVILRREITSRLRARLQQIQIANGYLTDAGLNVGLGREFANPDAPLPRLVLIPGGEGRVPEEIAQGAQVGQRLPILIEGAIAMDAGDPLGPGENLIADIKQALFNPNDKRLGLAPWVEELLYAPPLGEYVEREPGARWVRVLHGAVVRFREPYGNPRVAI